MGFWKNDDGDCLGDEPADLIAEHLRRLAETRGSKPTLPELLRGLDALLRAKTGDLCRRGEDKPFRAVVADVEDEAGVIEEVRAATEVEPRIRDALDVLCEEISDAYMRNYDDRPTRRELLRSFDFVLGYAPEDLIDIAEGRSVVEIRAI